MEQIETRERQIIQYL